MPDLADHIHLRRAGADGPLVVCVHCSASHSGQYKPYFDALSGRYRMVAPDLHGYGRSGALPRDGQPWFVHDAGILRALVAAEAPAKVHLVGHSLGGATVFYAARDMADRVASITMIEPVLFPLLAEAGDPLAADGEHSAAVIAGWLRLGRPERAAASFVEFWSGPGSWDALNGDTQGYVTQVIDRVGDDWAGMLGGLPGQARIADCAALNSVPVQLIRGTATRPSAAAITARLQAAMPWATVTDVEGADHMAAVTQPVEFIDRIGAFLAAHAGP